MWFNTQFLGGVVISGRFPVRYRVQNHRVNLFYAFAVDVENFFLDFFFLWFGSLSLYQCVLVVVFPDVTTDRY